jgi:hypothetical protein
VPLVCNSPNLLERKYGPRRSPVGFPHRAARQASMVRMSTGRSAKANAATATGSPSRHMLTNRAATVAAHRETTRANRRLTLTSSLPSSCPRSCHAARPCVFATLAYSVDASRHLEDDTEVPAGLEGVYEHCLPYLQGQDRDITGVSRQRRSFAWTRGSTCLPRHVAEEE